jgi:DNA mismatch repair protein MSH6
MACVVGDGTNSSSSSSTSTKEEDALSAATDTITFLYTLEEGSSPRSFGVNVARLAKLPQEVLLKLTCAHVLT